LRDRLNQYFVPFGWNQRAHGYDECTRYRYSKAPSRLTTVDGLEPFHINPIRDYADLISQYTQSNHSILQCRRDRYQSLGLL
jgi:hypothetical protein